MEEDPYNSPDRLAETETPPTQYRRLSGLLLFMAAVFGQAAVLALALLVETFFNPSRGPYAITEYSTASAATAGVSAALLWLSNWVVSLPSRLRFRFSLRTLFVLMTVVAVDVYLIHTWFWPAAQELTEDKLWWGFGVYCGGVFIVTAFAVYTVFQCVRNVRSFFSKARPLFTRISRKKK